MTRIALNGLGRIGMSGVEVSLFTGRFGIAFLAPD